MQAGPSQARSASHADCLCASALALEKTFWAAPTSTAAMRGVTPRAAMVGVSWLEKSTSEKKKMPGDGEIRGQGLTQHGSVHTMVQVGVNGRQGVGR